MVGDKNEAILSKYMIFIQKIRDYGGDEGIRTLETVSRLHP